MAVQVGQPNKLARRGDKGHWYQDARKVQQLHTRLKEAGWVHQEDRSKWWPAKWITQAAVRRRRRSTRKHRGRSNHCLVCATETETETLIMAAQEPELSTRSTEDRIHHNRPKIHLRQSSTSQQVVSCRRVGCTWKATSCTGTSVLSLSWKPPGQDGRRLRRWWPDWILGRLCNIGL